VRVFLGASFTSWNWKIKRKTLAAPNKWRPFGTYDGGRPGRRGHEWRKRNSRRIILDRVLRDKRAMYQAGWGEMAGVGDCRKKFGKKVCLVPVGSVDRRLCALMWVTAPSDRWIDRDRLILYRRLLYEISRAPVSGRNHCSDGGFPTDNEKEVKATSSCSCPDCSGDRLRAKTALLPGKKGRERAPIK